MKCLHDVLVLSTSWIPVHIVTWDKTINLLYQEKAHALDRTYFAYNYIDWKQFSSVTNEDFCWIHGPSVTLALPEIIVLTRFDKLPKSDIKYSRESVFSRDGHLCAYCGKQFNTKQLTIDHIIPRAHGGTTVWNNVVSSCFSCNQKKGDKTLFEAKMTLLYKPHKPKWFNPLDGYFKQKKYCTSWEHFMKRVNISNV